MKKKPSKSKPKSTGISTQALLIGAAVVALLIGAAVKASAAATTLSNPTKILRSGVTRSAETLDFSNGNKILLLTDGVVLKFTNPGATSTTITATDQLVNAEGYSTNATVAVHGGQTIYSGPWRRYRWADASGYLNISAAGLTTTTVESVRLPYGEEERYTK